MSWEVTHEMECKKIITLPAGHYFIFGCPECHRSVFYGPGEKTTITKGDETIRHIGAVKVRVSRELKVTL